MCGERTRASQTATVRMQTKKYLWVLRCGSNFKEDSKSWSILSETIGQEPVTRE